MIEDWRCVVRRRAAERVHVSTLPLFMWLVSKSTAELLEQDSHGPTAGYSVDSAK